MRVTRIDQLREQSVLVLDDLRRAPELHTALVHVVHDEDEGLRVLREIADSDVLLVATVIGERQRLVIEDLRNPGGPPRCWM